MNEIKEIIIIGGGKSIQEGIELGLKEKIKDKFVIAINYAYKFFPHTFLCFSDSNFYVPVKNKTNPEINPDIYEELKKESLIIGIDRDVTRNHKLNNTILLPKSYRESLTGKIALKIALNFNAEKIFLLGFDWNKRTNLKERDPNYSPKSNLQIHFYNDIKHRGVGYVGYYENHDADKEFGKFTKTNIKIYNVSLNSNLNYFEKINYPTMFNLLSDVRHNQKKLQDYIMEVLKCIK